MNAGRISRYSRLQSRLHCDAGQQGAKANTAAECRKAVRCAALRRWGGPFYVDYFDATVQWVETGARPSSRNLSVFALNSSGQISMTRPLCRFPTFARYVGGNPAVASSFVCSAS